MSENCNYVREERKVEKQREVINKKIPSDFVSLSRHLAFCVFQAPGEFPCETRRDAKEMQKIHKRETKEKRERESEENVNKNKLIIGLSSQGFMADA